MSAINPVGGSASAGWPTGGYVTGGPATAGSATDDRRRQRRAGDWHTVLEELEGEVLEAEETMARGRAEEIATWGRRAGDWVPPHDLGALPADLRERAARLLQHQLAVAEALVERITQSQKQRDVAARMSYGPDRPVAAFIDRAL